MSQESAARPAVNWNEEFRHSYMFSQGAPDVQVLIMNWLGRTMERGKLPPKKEMAGRMAAYGRGEAMRGGHKFSRDGAPLQFLWDAQTNADRFAGAMRTGGKAHKPFIPKGGFPDRPKDWSLETHEMAVALGIIERDFHYLVEERGRPITERDKWSSFLIDFGVLQKGTGPWKYAAMPESYKDLCEIVVDAATGTLYPLFGAGSISDCRGYEKLLKVINVYLEHHPDLSPDERAKVEEFREEVLAAGKAFKEEFAEKYPPKEPDQYEDFVRTLEEAATYVSPVPDVPE